MKKPVHDYLERYQKNGFKPILLKGYSNFNSGKDEKECYKEAKKPVSNGFTKEDYHSPTLKKIEEHRAKGGWIGYLLPKNVMAIDVENESSIRVIQEINSQYGITPTISKTQNGYHFLYLGIGISGASKAYTKCGIRVTYRAGGKNFLILPPENDREFIAWSNVGELPELPDELRKVDKEVKQHTLKALSYELHDNRNQLSGYEDLDAAYMAFLIESDFSYEDIRLSFSIIFAEDFDEKQTQLMYSRAKKKIESGVPLLRTGSFINKLKELNLKEALALSKKLQSKNRHYSYNEEWQEPIPLTSEPELTSFPLEALPLIPREKIKYSSEIAQVDEAMLAVIYLTLLSRCALKKLEIDMVSHTEQPCLYAAPCADVSERKSRAMEIMLEPLKEYQSEVRDKIRPRVIESESRRKLLEAQSNNLKNKAAKEKIGSKKQGFEREFYETEQELSEELITIPTVFIASGSTEEIGRLMARNNQSLGLFSTEGGIFDIMAGLYSSKDLSNFDLYLKAYSGDYFSDNKVTREPVEMKKPNLAMCVTLQPQVLKTIGNNERFRGRGLLSRFLYAMCQPKAGYRIRQSRSIPVKVNEKYNQHITGILNIPIPEKQHTTKMTPEADVEWTEFYNDIEKELRPGGKLESVKDWAGKLPGNVARIAGLLHFAEYGVEAFSSQIDDETVINASAIGGYLIDHGLAAFGYMSEDKHFAGARKILQAIERHKPERFKTRDILTWVKSFKKTEEVLPCLSILIDRGYVKEEIPQITGGKGRPEATKYLVTPFILKKLHS